MDPFGFEAANLLAGNSPTRAALEVGAGELALRARSDCVIGVAGAGYGLGVNIWQFSLWSSYFVRAGWTIQLRQNGFGMWAYLAMTGGIQAPEILNSRSTYLRGQLGGIEGRTVQAGDILRSAAAPQLMMEAAGQSLARDCRPAYGEEPSVEVIHGPQGDQFSDAAWETFLTNAYGISSSSDRMGYRLAGPSLMHATESDLTSEGVAVGSVQVPPDGMPIVMMADSATTGGYPKIATVIRADLPLLAQCTPGRDRVRFRLTTIEAAQQRLWESQQRLISGIVSGQD